MREAQFLSHSNPLCPFIGHPAASLPGVATSSTAPTQVEETNNPSSLPEEKALVPSAQDARPETLISPQGPVARLPVEVEVGIPVRDFRVRHLLALAPGTVVESEWGHGDDVPLASGDVQLAWSEFEVIDAQIAVRLTRLA
jgi:flagellar motor switch/type III secretory pathway protein FliN